MIINKPSEPPTLDQLEQIAKDANVPPFFRDFGHNLLFQTAFSPATALKLIEALRVARAEMRLASACLNGIKFDLESRVYTLDEDEMGTVFAVRDDLDLKQAHIAEILGET